MSQYFRVVLSDTKGKQYSFPIKWLVDYVQYETTYPTMVDFTQKCTSKEVGKAIKAAQKDNVGEFINRKE